MHGADGRLLVVCPASVRRELELVTQIGNLEFKQYLNTRNFAGDPEAGEAGDLAPEVLVFVPAHQSPSRRPLLAVAYEVSGTVSVFEFD